MAWDDEIRDEELEAQEFFATATPDDITELEFEALLYADQNQNHNTTA